MPARLLTDEQRRVIDEMYPTHPTAEIAAKIGRSIDCVYGYASRVGLKKSPEYMKAELQKQADRLRVIGAKSRFQSGQEPANKGKPMKPETKAKLAHTFFPKGHKPHNTKYDGYERLSKDGYYEVRIDGKFVLKHRHLWEQANGKIPRGYAVVFKDRNPQNITLDNLELINRKELMNRNTIHRYPEEIKSTMKLLGKLKRTIDAKKQD